jgi:LysM repeat protein
MVNAVFDFMRARLNWGLLLLLPILVLAAAACDNDEPDETPAPEVPTLPITQIVRQPSHTPGGPTFTPSPTFPATVTPRPTDLPPEVQPSATPTETPPPYIILVQPGDTCGGIAVRYGLDIRSGAAAIRRANNLNERCTDLPSPGTPIIVPRPTLTPSPQGFDVTQTAIVTALPPSLRDVTPYALYEYCPVPDDTLTSIALRFGSTNKRICELNPLPDGIDCSGCDFSQSAVGFCPNPPLISTTNCLMVPGPTATPTFTPTFTGQETPTPTPTYTPPRLVIPANDTTHSGPLEFVWVSAGQLQPGEVYVISVTDELTGQYLIQAVRAPSFSMPPEWEPPAGQMRDLVWTVEVAVLDPQSGLYMPTSGKSPTYRVAWQGR